MMGTTRVRHDLRWAATPKGVLKSTPWGWQPACVCGWQQEGLRGSKKDGLNAYRKHKNDETMKFIENFWKDTGYHHTRCT